MCVCVACGAVETFCTCKILFSEVSVADMLCDHAAALEAVIFRGKKKKKSSYSFIFFCRNFL